jgi:methylmalonyl-CoA/ethylmalonyl-CoA epimerase
MDDKGHKTAAGAPFRLHHIGMAVSDLESGRAFYRTLGFVDPGPVFADPVQKVEVQFICPSRDVQIELIAPACDDSPISRFLQQRGPGLHHLCYEVADLDAACEYLRSQKSVMACAPVPAVAFGGRRISFHYWRRQIIELLEAEKPIA